MNATSNIWNGIASIVRFFGFLIIGYIIFALVAATIKAIFGGEQEGTVKTDDCRQVVQIQPDDIRTYFQKFTCFYDKTSKGTIRSGFCAHVDSPWFSTSCDTAYTYNVPQDPHHCTDPSYPYLAYDDKCYPPCKAPYPFRGLGTDDNSCYQTSQY